MARIHDEQGHRTVVTDPGLPGVRVVVAYLASDDGWIGHLYHQRAHEAERKVEYEGGLRATKQEAIDAAFAVAVHLA